MVGVAYLGRQGSGYNGIGRSGTTRGLLPCMHALPRLTHQRGNEVCWGRYREQCSVCEVKCFVKGEFIR